MNKSVFIFSVAIDGYASAWRSNIESHRKYCEKYNYKYHCFDGDGNEVLGREVAWLKVPLLLGCLENFDIVLFLDADTKIQLDCPKLEDWLSEDAPILIAPGHSGRANTGVIGLYNTLKAKEFLRKSLSLAGTGLAARYSVGWGENGYLIKVLDELGVKLADKRWNNTFDPDLDDFIRHFTGPFRSTYQFEGDALIAWNEILARPKAKGENSDIERATFYDELRKLYTTCTKNLEYFNSYEASWQGFQDIHSDSGLNVHITEDITSDYKNPYVLDILEELSRNTKIKKVTNGVEEFWVRNFEPGTIIHIQWVESLFDWKLPTKTQVENFGNRLKELKQYCRIFYTVHNYELMASYGSIRDEIYNIFFNYVDCLIHLHEENISLFNTFNSKYSKLSEIPCEVVPHHDYQRYFSEESTPFKDPALEDEKTKLLVFGGIRNQTELDLILETADLLGEEYRLCLFGPISQDLIHWKEIEKLSRDTLLQVRRVHRPVDNTSIVSLLSQVDGVVVPRSGRLNSGVQTLGLTFSLPVFCTPEGSIGKIAQESCSPEVSEFSSKGLSEAIKSYYSKPLDLRISQRLQAFNFINATSRLSKTVEKQVCAYLKC